MNEQGLFVDIIQTLYCNKFINGTIEHQMKTENFVHHPQNSNKMFCLQKLKDFKIGGGIRGSGEKDSSSTLTEISNSVQSVNESTYDFVMKLMCKQEKVLILAKEKDCPYDEKLVQHQILHAISTGRQNNNIHSDLCHVLQTEVEWLDKKCNELVIDTSIDSVAFMFICCDCYMETF